MPSAAPPAEAAAVFHLSLLFNKVIFLTLDLLTKSGAAAIILCVCCLIICLRKQAVLALSNRQILQVYTQAVCTINQKLRGR